MKRKNLLVIAILSMTMALSGCAFLDQIIDDISGNGQSEKDFDGEKTDITGKTIMNYTYSTYGDNNVYNLDYCPTTGSVKLLIIPVWFKNSSTFIRETYKENVRADIETAYLGTNSEAGWRSVKTYYEELSMGDLTISGVVSDWYSTNYTYQQAGNSDTGGGVTCELVNSASDWFFQNNPSQKRKDFDSDNNGYLDAVLLIYAAPDYSSLDDDSLSNLWAYAFWLQEDKISGTPTPNAFFWASYDFMYGTAKSFARTGLTRYNYGDTSHCNVDSHTFIHEMGHVFGLEDYYDYSTNKYSPAGGFSMQDENVGCHDPYSVMALGWANPYVVTEDSEVTIGAFQKNRDLVVISSDWNGIGSPFDEYLILELYTPTGLNQFDCTYGYFGGSVSRGPSSTGIRLWHVDARLVACKDIKNKEPVYYPSNITSNPIAGYDSYGVVHAFSNSYNKDYGSVLGSKYYNYNILQLIRCDVFSSYTSKSSISSSDLFFSGSYDLSSYGSQFVNGDAFNKKENKLDWSFRIEISGSGEDATAKISIVK